LANTYTGLIIDYTWWVVYKDTYPATPTGEMYRDAAINYISKIADISITAYDGRIQEDAIIVPELSPKFLLLFIVPTIIVVSVLLKRKQLMVRHLK
ncbi:MAG: hypothetical protein GPJ51_06830, partial [Candidatus Heimdallarchaeota archaeon]|nr:hypothetical protein [Candidatus Heimdallarchaeota archaeon]